MQPKEYADLEANILADGCKDSLVVWNGVLIDGHNRLAICQKHALPFKVTEWEFKSESEAELWILKNQLGRRNLTDDQRAMLADEAAELESKLVVKERAKQAVAVREAKAGRKEPILSANASNKIEKQDTRAKSAKRAGVSERRMKKARAVRKADPELAKKVVSGEVTLAKAAATVAKAEKRNHVKTQEWPKGKYRVIYSDPPWQYGDARTGTQESGGVVAQYETMSLKDICALPVKELATKDAVLFLWATSPLIPEAIEVVKAWGFCCATGTKILTDDLRWVAAETLCKGDKILAFDEERRNGRRYFKWGTVLNTGIEPHLCYEIELKSGNRLVCTGEHRWLMRTSLTGRESSHRWIKTEEIHKHITHHNRTKPLGISRLVPVAIPDMSYDAGFLSGAFDSEGSWRKKKGGLMFAQKDKALMSRVVHILKKKKYTFGRYASKTSDCSQLGITGGIDEALRFMMEFRPPRLLENWLKVDVSKISLYNRKTDAIKSVKSVGMRDVVVLTTDTATYFAEGFGAHNTYKASYVWNKIRGFNGHYNDVQHELLLVATKGSCLPEIDTLPKSVITEEKGKHSAKPESFRSLIDKLYPSGPRIEMFARTKTPGWDTWGNEV